MVITLPIANSRHVEHDTERLRDAVTTLDALAQETLGEIATIARLALLGLEQREIAQWPEHMARVLRAIECRADDSRNAMNVTAEEVGCNWQDPGEKREARPTERSATSRPAYDPPTA